VRLTKPIVAAVLECRECARTKDTMSKINRLLVGLDRYRRRCSTQIQDTLRRLIDVRSLRLSPPFSHVVVGVDAT